MKQLILYDLDGTLVDTRQDLADAANAMLRQMGQPPLPVATICRFVGQGLHHLVQECLTSDDPQWIERGAALFAAWYAEHLLDHSHLYPGVPALLAHFQSRSQAVITNKPNPFTRELLAGLRVTDYFCAVIAGDSEFPKKPDPAAVVSVMAQVQASPEQSLLIGDSPIDVQTGRAAGVLTIGVAHGFSADAALREAGPDVLVNDIHELLARARREAW